MEDKRRYSKGKIRNFKPETLPYYMVFFTIFFNLFFVSYSWAQIEVKVDWQDTKKKKVKIFVEKHDPSFNKCKKSGAQILYTYETELCVRRRSWIADRCQAMPEYTRTLTFDPITETYVVYSDKIGDKLPAEKSTYTSVQEAMNALSTVADLKITLNEQEKRRQYLSVKVRFVCQGQSSALLNRLSQVITLGIASVEGVDSGWQDFYFD